MIPYLNLAELSWKEVTSKGHVGDSGRDVDVPLRVPRTR